jgi:hypothetical protein
MEHNENTKLMYVLVCEQEAPGRMWQISGPPGLLVAGSTLSAALAAVSKALIKIAMAEAIGDNDDH